MQISKSSWHYRFTDTFISGFAGKVKRGQHTTCSYIRAVFYAICACLLSVSFFGTIGLAGVFTIGCMAVIPVMIFCGVASIAEPFLVACTMGWIAVGLVLAVLTISFVLKNASEWSEKRHSLMIQAMQDKKDGICTIVHIQD